MGLSDVYCAICAGPFITGSPSEDYPDELFDWTCDFRLVSRVSFTTSSNHLSNRAVNISPQIPGMLSNPCIIRGSEGIKNAFKMSDTGYQAKDWKLYDIERQPGDVLYPMHEACLVLLQKFVGKGSYLNDGTSVLEGEVSHETAAFYDALCAQMGRNDEVSPAFVRYDHGHYGAAQFCGPEGWDAEAEWADIGVDPVNIPDLTAFVLSLCRPIPEPAKNSVSTASKVDISHSFQTVSKTKSLSTLTPEILQLIASHLPTTSILSFRRTCHHINAAIPTDQFFWRSQLLSHSLLPWLWDLDTAAVRCHVAPHGQTWDWECLCRQLKTPVFNRAEAAKTFRKGPRRMFGELMGGPQGLTLAERRKLSEGMKNAPAGLWNRRRIWKICQDVMATPNGEEELDDNSSGDDDDTEDEDDDTDSVDAEVWSLITGRY